MIDVPPATPVSVPVEPSIEIAGEPLVTVATEVLLLLHVPHDKDEVNIVDEPAHTLAVPDIDGTGFTSISSVVVQPKVPVLVKVIVTLPTARPVTSPEVEPIVATSVLLLLHNTPEPVPDNVVVEPTHTLVAPVMPETALTEITKVADAEPQEVVDTV